MYRSLEDRCRRWSVRVGLSFLLVAASAGVLVSSAAGNNQAARLSNNGCIGSACSIRGIRSQIVHLGTWNLPSGSPMLEAMWVGGQDTFTSSHQGLVQAGMMKATTGIDKCSSSTGGVVESFYYWIGDSGNDLACVLGAEVSPGGSHSYKVQRCGGSSLWCTFNDGNQVGSSHDIGLATAPWREAVGEYSCNSCGSGSDDIDANFGGSDATNKFSVTECGTTGCNPVTWTNIANSDTTTFDNSCDQLNPVGKTSANWSIGTVNQGAQWEIFSALPVTC
jgi:hypothetical protein